jgi:hypothetical protein
MRVVVSTFVFVAASNLACSGTTTHAAPGDAGVAGDSSVASDASVDTGASGLTLAQRSAAVSQTLSNDATCSALTELYWEIGDANGALASGSVGAVKADTLMSIASASKLVWGAYVVERFKSDLTMIDSSAMHMESGYVSLGYDSCVGTASVSACFMAANNSVHTASEDGKFHYNGGHFQKYAIDLGLGTDDNAKLATDMKSLLGTELAFTFGSPQLAGGVHTSASDYAALLRKILAGKLAIRDHLGENAVCTQPATCQAATYSPAPAAWHYSYGHWIEDDPAGDGAFSSPGAFGFYPWIDATKTYYGVLARYAPLVPQAYVQSAKCGALLRKAFMTGVAQ